MSRLTQHWHRIEATGKGQFPFDMLRYDQCFPLYPSDVTIMEHPTDEDEVVALGHWGPSSWLPTHGR